MTKLSTQVQQVSDPVFRAKVLHAAVQKSVAAVVTTNNKANRRDLATTGKLGNAFVHAVAAVLDKETPSDEEIISAVNATIPLFTA